MLVYGSVLIFWTILALVSLHATAWNYVYVGGSAFKHNVILLLSFGQNLFAQVRLHAFRQLPGAVPIPGADGLLLDANVNAKRPNTSRITQRVRFQRQREG